MILDRNIQRRLIASVLFGLLVFIGLAIFGDIRAVSASLRSLNWWLVPVVFALALGNYTLRIARWVYYLRRLGIELPLRDSVTIFMSGLAMSITPGKMGEVVKCYFLKRMCGTPLRRSFPIVFAERFTDLLAIVLLAAVGVFRFQYGQVVLWIGVGLTAGLLVVIMNRRLAIPLLQLIGRLPLLHRAGGKLLDVYEHAYGLLRPVPLATATVLGVVSWFCECVGFYVTLRALGAELPVPTTTFIYAFSTLFGAVTMLPGGLVTTEGSMTGLSILQGVPKDVASAATIVIRLATLWFAVVLGLLWLTPNRDALIPDKAQMLADAELDARNAPA